MVNAMTTYFAVKIRPETKTRIREIAKQQRGTTADLFDDMLRAYEEKHLKKIGFFGFGKKNKEAK